MIKLVKPILSLLLIASVAFLSSCGEDDPKPKTKTDLIAAHTWKMTRLKVGTLEGDPEDCLADDTYIYEADGDYRFSEGTSKCDPDDPQSGTGDWELKSDESILAVSETVSGITISYNYTILELTETKMRLKFDFIPDQSIEATFEPN